MGGARGSAEARAGGGAGAAGVDARVEVGGGGVPVVLSMTDLFSRTTNTGEEHYKKGSANGLWRGPESNRLLRANNESSALFAVGALRVLPRLLTACSGAPQIKSISTLIYIPQHIIYPSVPHIYLSHSAEGKKN